MKLLPMVSILFLSGCTTVTCTIPQCEMNANGWYKTPCIGWGNGTQASPVESDMIALGLPYYKVAIINDEHNIRRTIRVY